MANLWKLASSLIRLGGLASTGLVALINLGLTSSAFPGPVSVSGALDAVGSGS
jgi:hypothetical protein